MIESPPPRLGAGLSAPPISSLRISWGGSVPRTPRKSKGRPNRPASLGREGVGGSFLHFVRSVRSYYGQSWTSKTPSNLLGCVFSEYGKSREFERMCVRLPDVGVAIRMLRSRGPSDARMSHSTFFAAQRVHHMWTCPGCWCVLCVLPVLFFSASQNFQQHSTRLLYAFRHGARIPGTPGCPVMEGSEWPPVLLGSWHRLASPGPDSRSFFRSLIRG